MWTVTRAAIDVPLRGVAALLLVLATGGALPAQESDERDRRFAEMMTGKRLVGQFSVVTAEGESPPQADNYMVSELSRGEGARWIFTARMGSGPQAVALPIPVDVLWAGDTPVLTMTEQAIEGLGTFTARVLIHDGRYAGTWQHGPVGGNMWGRVVVAAAEPGGEASAEAGAGAAAGSQP